MKPVFEPLKPPPGGLQRLQSRLRQDRQRRSLRWTATTAMLVAAIVLLWISRPSPSPTSNAVSSAASQTVAVNRVFESDAVVFYEVAGLELASAPDLR